jgi:hypothetical protein
MSNKLGFARCHSVPVLFATIPLQGRNLLSSIIRIRNNWFKKNRMSRLKEILFFTI